MRFSPHDDDRDSVVGRGLLILEVFGRSQGRELRLSAIASAAGLSKATTYRLTQILVARKFLERTGPYYRLGIRLFELGSLAVPRRGLGEYAMPFMTDLFEATHETVHLAVRDRFELIYLVKLRGHRIGTIPTAAGSRMPLYSTALGKILLAGEPDTVVDATIARGLRPLTPNTITRGEALHKTIEAARAEGVAFDREESVPELSCVSAPILDSTARVVAALSVSASVRRTPRIESLMPIVVSAARGISEQLGSPPRTAEAGVRSPA
jgi:DNA-binding IclR family transcriptional regulator